MAALTDSSAGPPAGATSTVVPGLLNIGIDAQTGASTTPQGNVLITKLAQQLRTLQDQLAKGEQPDPDLLGKLGETADALAALIAKPGSSSTAPSLDPLATIKAAESKADSEKALDIPESGSSKTPSTPDQITQLLAAIGIQLPQAPTTTTPAADSSTSGVAAVTASAPATPLPAIAQFATQLSQLSQAVAPAAPEVAQKLDALTQKLNAAETDPSVLAQLTTPDDTGATSLDKIVQALLAAKPTAAATPSTPIATDIQLQPASLPGAPQVIERMPSTPDASAAPSATTPSPRPVDSPKPADPASRSDTTADAKIVAAATTPTDTKTDAASPSSQANTNAVAAPAATQTAPRVIPAAYQAASSPINMTQVAFEMVRQIHQGQSRFTIRIDPPELGRVDVRMHVDSSGNVNARLTVERSETLDMFQRDRGSLEKALTQAGLDGAKTNLEFSLKQNPFAGMSGSDQRPGNGNPSTPRFALNSADTEDTTVSSIPSVTLYRGVASAGGINLFV